MGKVEGRSTVRICVFDFGPISYLIFSHKKRWYNSPGLFKLTNHRSLSLFVKAEMNRREGKVDVKTGRRIKDGHSRLLPMLYVDVRRYKYMVHFVDV